MAKRTPATEQGSAYLPPQRCLGPCRQCGIVVQGRTWVNGQWREELPRLSPILGEVHVCRVPDDQPHTTEKGAA